MDDALNTPVWKKTSTRFRGISKFENKWKAEFMLRGEKFYLGLFNTEIEAAQAYDKKASELLGDKAKLNKKLNNYE